MKISLYLFIASSIVNISFANDLQISSSSVNLLTRMNEELMWINRASARLSWESATRPSDQVFALKKQFSRMRNEWRNNWCWRLQDIRVKDLLEDRMIYLLCRGPRYTSSEAEALTTVLDELMINYETRKVCRIELNVTKCYNGEPELKKLMMTSRNESELRWAWIGWRNEMSNVKQLFTISVHLQNIGARNNGYNDIGECWREELEIPNLEMFVDALYEEIEILYRLLHAVVRFRLAEAYPEIVKPDQPIPAHLLGDLWSQNWESLIDLILPSSNSFINITEAMKKKNYTVKDMVERAEDYYMSLDFPPMSNKFWLYSTFIKKNISDTVANCHASAANMFDQNDYRITACMNVNVEDFYVIHHEMGHIQYYMAYENQPAIFHNGVNSAFHEAIGDAVMLGVMTPQHLLRLGLVEDSVLKDDFSILLRQALSKLPQLPHAIVMDKWRWNVFANKRNSTSYNALWWELHRRYMGIEPPDIRTDDYFDPAAKFHIVSNTPYIRYFLANILQYQIFAGMCESAVTGKVGDANFSMKLNRCDIYGSKLAGKRLRSLMKLGSSVNWRKWIREISGNSGIQVKPMLRYYEPLKNWLELEIARYRISVGWN